MTICADPNGLEHCYHRGRPAGVELPTVNLADGRGAPVGGTARILRRLRPQLAWKRANERLTETVTRIAPDVVWIFKGMEVYPGTLRRLRAQGLTLVNYNADHPFLFFSRGSGNINVKRAIPEYDLHLTYSRRIARELTERYPSMRIAVVPFGHEVGDEMYARIATEEEIERACFLGNPDEHRAKGVMRLFEAGIPVDVFGFRWDRFLSPSRLLRINGQAVGEDLLRTLRRYRMQLNFFRPHNKDSHNMRTFEVPACGGIMLAEDSVEHRTFFESGREAFFFSSPDEMIGLARHLLVMPRGEADAVRAAARRRSVEGGYSYRHRAEAAFAAIAAAHAARRQPGGELAR
jgi:hypothetical protein